MHHLIAQRLVDMSDLLADWRRRAAISTEAAPPAAAAVARLHRPPRLDHSASPLVYHGFLSARCKESYMIRKLIPFLLVASLA
ncbi:hypothetical protein CTI14_53940, partial [Methylobacterium radiotolerans]